MAVCRAGIRTWTALPDCRCDTHAPLLGCRAEICSFTATQALEWADLGFDLDAALDQAPELVSPIVRTYGPREKMHQPRPDPCRQRPGHWLDVNAQAPAVADCGRCRFCLDKPRFGGPHKLRRACEQKQAAHGG